MSPPSWTSSGLRARRGADAAEIFRMEGEPWQVGEDALALEWTHDGGGLLAAGADGWIRLMDTATGELRGARDLGAPALCLRRVPGRARVVAGTADGRIQVLDLETGERLREIEAHPEETRDVAPLPDGRRVASVGNDPFLVLWDLETGEEVRRIEFAYGKAQVCVASPEGRVVACAGAALPVQGYEVETGREVLGNPSAETATSLTLAGSGRWLVAGGGSRGGLELWNLHPWLRGPLRTLQRSRVEGGESPGGIVLASSAASGVVSICPIRRALFDVDLRSRRVVGWVGLSGVSLTPHPAGRGLRAVVAALSPDGALLALATRRGRILRVPRPFDATWTPDPRRGQVLQARLEPRRGRVFLLDDGGALRLADPEQAGLARALPATCLEVPVAFEVSGDGGDLLLGTSAGVLLAWAVGAPEGTVEIRQYDGLVESVAWLPSRGWIAGVDSEGILGVWERRGGHRRLRRKQHARGHTRVVALPDRALLGTAGADGRVVLWDLDREEEHRVFDLGSPIRALAAAPDGRTLAALDGTGGLHVLDLVHGRRALREPREAGVGTAVAFVGSPGRLAWGRPDGSVRLARWEVRGGATGRGEGRLREVGDLPAHSAVVVDLDAAEDGRRLVSVGGDGALRVHDLL